MPTAFYPILTPGDLNAIVAYLRSLTPVKNKVPDPIYKIALPHHVFPGAEKSYSQADLNDKLKRGFYLATIGHCMECHTPFVPPGGPDFANSLGKGGREFPGPVGRLEVAQHHLAQDRRHRRLDRRRDQDRDHPGQAQGRHAAQGPDGLPVLRQDDRRRPRRRHRLSADAAGEGIGPFSAPALAPGQGMAGPAPFNCRGAGPISRFHRLGSPYHA